MYFSLNTKHITPHTAKMLRENIALREALCVYDCNDGCFMIPDCLKEADAGAVPEDLASCLIYAIQHMVPGHILKISESGPLCCGALRIYNEWDLEEAPEESVRLWTELLSAADMRKVAATFNWGLNRFDIIAIGKICRDNPEYRDKAAELLTECNFHREARALKKGDYEEFLA